MRAMHRTSTTSTHCGTLVKAIMTHGSVLWSLLPLLLLTLSNLTSPVSDASRIRATVEYTRLVAIIFATLLRKVCARTRARHFFAALWFTRSNLFRHARTRFYRHA